MHLTSLLAAIVAASYAASNLLVAGNLNLNQTKDTYFVSSNITDPVSDEFGMCRGSRSCTNCAEDSGDCYCVDGLGAPFNKCVATGGAMGQQLLFRGIFTSINDSAVLLKVYQPQDTGWTAVQANVVLTNNTCVGISAFGYDFGYVMQWWN